MAAGDADTLPGLEPVARGKVRDVYAVDDEHLLFVASDRISAFDVIMANPIPGKGRILTQMSLFWFERLADHGPHHLVTGDLAEMPARVRALGGRIEGRAMLVEAIVRGYLAGSGWKEYRDRGTVCDIPLPAGLHESERLPEPLYTPSTKAALGDHDQNIAPDRAAEIVGAERNRAIAERAIALYAAARDHAAERGILIADTKFEFGVDRAGELILADEVLTPDSSRFWPADDYAPGRPQHAFDKQYVRDYLESIDFDKRTPVELPREIVDRTLERYVEAFRRLTGREPEM